MTQITARLLAAVMAAFLLLSVALLGGCSSQEETAVTETTTAVEVPTTTTFPTMSGELIATDVIVRSGPGFDYDGIGGMTKGEEFTIVDHEGDWYKIIFGDGYGYICAAFADVEGQPNASQMVAEFTTVSQTTTTSRTKPQSLTTSAASGTTATSAAPASNIPDTAVVDEF